MMKKEMTLLISLAFFCLAIFMMTSCGTTSSSVEGEAAPPAKTTEEAPMVEQEEEVAVIEEQEPIEEEAIEPSRPMPAPEEPAEEAGSYLTREIEAFQSENVYFDFDKSDLKPEAQATLRKKAAWLKENPSFSVRIEGHCDERGTNEYNLALGERRAESAAKYLRSLGISSSRLSTLSYGEEKPAVYGSYSEAWAKNRRDEFVLIK